MNYSSIASGKKKRGNVGGSAARKRAVSLKKGAEGYSSSGAGEFA